MQWTDLKVRSLQAKLSAAQAELHAALREVASGVVTDYVFATLHGEVKLCDLFASKCDQFRNAQFLRTFQVPLSTASLPPFVTSAQVSRALPVSKLPSMTISPRVSSGYS